MDGDYFHNSLAYDEQVVAEKLGIYDYSPKPSDDVNINLKLALMQEELANSKRQLSQLKRNAPRKQRRNFVRGVIAVDPPKDSGINPAKSQT